MKVLDVYTKKEYTCKKCNAKIYYGKITDDAGNIYTTDGQMPNGKYGKETNVLSGAVDALVKDNFHKCSLPYIEDAVAKAPAPPTAGGVKMTEVTTQKSNLDNFTPEYVSETDKVQWTDIVRKVTEYSILADISLDDYPEITNPASKGQIKNIAFAIMENIKEHQRNGD